MGFGFGVWRRAKNSKRPSSNIHPAGRDKHQVARVPWWPGNLAKKHEITKRTHFENAIIT